MTVSGEWDLILGQDGGIIGVRSRSRQKPLGRFPMTPPANDSPAANATYRDWQFKFEPVNSTGGNIDSPEMSEER